MDKSVATKIGYKGKNRLYIGKKFETIFLPAMFLLWAQCP